MFSLSGRIEDLAEDDIPAVATTRDLNKLQQRTWKMWTNNDKMLSHKS